MASTVEVPAEFVPYLKSAAIYTLGEEAGRVHEGEKKVWEVERPEKVELAEDELSNVRPFLDMMMPLAQEILALPDGKPAKVSNDVELTYYVLANMASKIVGPRIAANLDYLPLPEKNPELAGAFGWASTESVRLENARIAEIKQNGEAV